MSLADFTQKSEQILADVSAKVASKAKIPLSVAWSIIQTAMAASVLQIEQSVGNSLAGADKKAQVMNVVSAAIDIVLGSISIPYIPNWVNSIISKYLKLFLMQIANGGIDSLVSVFNTTNVIPVVPVAATAVVNTVIPPTVKGN